MPAVKRFQCCRCRSEVVSPSGEGFPSRWTEVRVSETVGGGVEGFGKRMPHLVAKVLFCSGCFPRDFRSMYDRRKRTEEELMRIG